jgi:hypothetical protein
MRHYANNLLQYDNGKILDLRMGYSYDEFTNYLNNLGDGGRNYYRTKFHFVDTFYPIIYGMFYLLVIRFLLKFYTRKKPLDMICLLPLIGVLCDYGENIIINFYTKNIDNITVGGAAAASYFTIIKFIFIYISLIIFIVLLLLVIINKRRKV